MKNEFIMTLSSSDSIESEDEQLFEYSDSEFTKKDSGFCLNKVKKLEKINPSFVFDVEKGYESALDYERNNIDESYFGTSLSKKGVNIEKIIQKQSVKSKNKNHEIQDETEFLDESEVSDMSGIRKNSDEESCNEKSENELSSFSDFDMTEEETVEEKNKKKRFFEENCSSIQNDFFLSFSEFNLSRPILKALESIGFDKPTTIQSKTIPVALLGKDIVGSAITGSGKTGAFVIPVLERLLYRPKKIAVTRVLILCPTRELAIQCYTVTKKLSVYTDIKTCICTGGLSLKVQEAELRKRPDIVIATPGRFIDHVRNSYGFSPDSIEIMVIDEADRILEEGFQEELDEIIKICPKSRQTILFSATMTDKVDRLVKLSLNKPVRLFIDQKNSTVKSLVQEFIRIKSHKEHFRTAVLLYLCSDVLKTKTIIFFRNKSFVHKIRIIFGLLHLNARELHGNLSQEQRIESLEFFRQGKTNFLLATDLASRGLDIKGVKYVINYETPQSFDTYLHRVGRTARAGCHGIAITLVGEDDRKIVKMATKMARKHGNILRNRTVPFDVINAYNIKLQNLENAVQNVLKEEKEEKELLKAEMELQKSQNLVKHEKEIKSRLPRTWFLSKNKKKTSKDAFSVNSEGVKNQKKRKNENNMQIPTRTYKKTATDRLGPLLKRKKINDNKKSKSIKKKIL
ncbi:hypothetical protein PORY_000217 [Pneumocystis oryctolagi]|uniref:Uncharacterized protein n=1 Tax=Pneumocystis oryctolagi TaxID=42067 RepID=A0ACB7CJD4_9ASCO|nr:hypothetical protein PORY_000217 [Pneumocystis oryctolagi]